MADSSGTASTELFQSLVEGGLAALFDDKEICDLFKAGLKEAGCSPPFHIIVFTVLKKLALLGWDFGGQALRTRLFELLTRNERLSKWLDRIANICRECEDKIRLKGIMIATLRGELHQGPAPKIDDATDAQVLAQLYTRQRFAEQDAQLDAIAVALQDLLTEKSGDAIAPYLGWAEGNGATIADSIRYNSGLYDFEGRDREIDLLDRFCGDPSLALPGNRFSWLLLTGPGGEGKTRLALEYTTERIGGNWHAGRLSLPDLKQFRHGEWLPARSTLIVIDYPAQGPDSVHALLSNLARRHRAFDWPVHVLLLEREAQGQWFDSVFPSSSDGAAIRAHAFTQDGHHFLDGLAVEPLGLEAIISIMEGRFLGAGLDPPNRGLLLKALSRVDKRAVETEQGPLPFPRPLFAAAVAEVMIATLHRGEAIDSDWVGALDRELVLAEIVRRDREMHWLPCAGGRRDVLIRHENLVALATLAGGMKRSHIRNLPRDIAELLPDSGEAGSWPLSEDLIRRMGGYEHGRISPLEPDLLGEYFLLDRLARMNEVEGECARRSICALAFELGGMEAVGSALRAALDFPDRAEALEWLLPGPDASRASLEGASALVVDLTGIIGVRAVPALDRLAKNWEQEDGQIAIHLAMALANVTSHAGRTCDWDQVDVMLAGIDRLRAIFPKVVEIAFEEAKAAVNVLPFACSAGEWARIDAMLARIDRLRLVFPTQPGVALQEAKAAVNLVSRGACDRPWLEAILARIDRACAAFPEHAEIALRAAMAAFNVTHFASEIGDWDLVEAMLARMDRLRATYTDAGDIALEEARVAGTVALNAGKAGEWARVDGMVARIDRLRIAFPHNAKIALEEATAAFNISLCAKDNWPRVDAMLARIERLRITFPEYAEIRHREARAALIAMGSAGEAGDGGRIQTMLAKIDSVRAGYPGDVEIAPDEARAAFISIHYAGEADDVVRVGAMFARIDRLRVAFPQRVEIALEEAKAAFNFMCRMGRAGDWARVDAMFTRLDRVRAAFPSETRIAMEEAKAAVNASNFAKDVGDWARVDAMLERGRMLVDAGFALPASEQLLRLWRSAIFERIMAGQSIGLNLVQELRVRFEMALTNSPAKLSIDLLGSLILIKYLHASGFADILTPLIDGLAKAGVDWSVVSTFDPDTWVE
jgi:hypothetical protein